MLKQIAVRLEEDLIKTAKLKAVEEGVSIQTVFAQALESYFGNKVTNKQVNMVTSEQPKKVRKVTSENVNKVIPPAPAYTPSYPNPLDYEPTDEDLYYILRKTAKTKLIHQYAQFQYGPVFWMVLDGCKAHYDKDGEPIPYRFTDQNGKVQEPDAEQLQEIENLLGKPVKIEK